MDSNLKQDVAVLCENIVANKKVSKDDLLKHLTSVSIEQVNNSTKEAAKQKPLGKDKFQVIHQNVSKQEKSDKQEQSNIPPKSKKEVKTIDKVHQNPKQSSNPPKSKEKRKDTNKEVKTVSRQNPKQSSIPPKSKEERKETTNEEVKTVNEPYTTPIILKREASKKDQVTVINHTQKTLQQSIFF